MYNVLLFTDGGWMVDQKEVIHENTVVPFLYFATPTKGHASYQARLQMH